MRDNPVEEIGLAADDVDVQRLYEAAREVVGAYEARIAVAHTQKVHHRRLTCLLNMEAVINELEEAAE